MTNETILMIETELPIMMQCADGIGIEKGSILKLTDPLLAELADGDADIVAGIAAAEKIANDGQSMIPVYRKGIFKMLAGDAIAVGVQVMTKAGTGGANEITTGTNAALGSKGLGIALETAADTNTLLVELNIGTAPNVLA